MKHSNVKRVVSIGSVLNSKRIHFQMSMEETQEIKREKKHDIHWILCVQKFTFEGEIKKSRREKNSYK